MAGGRRPSQFWREVSGQLYFTPRFGNEFLFGPNGGVAAADFPALGGLVEDFAGAVSAGEFDEELLRIASSLAPLVIFLEGDLVVMKMLFPNAMSPMSQGLHNVDGRLLGLSIGSLSIEPVRR